MLTMGELKSNPKRVEELGGYDVLVSTEDEEVVQTSASGGTSTVVFEHETIKMMMAERAEKHEKLKSLLTDGSQVIPLRKKAESFWDNITVGRASTADIVLDDPAISNVHAHFEVDDDGKFSVQDVGSSNGTQVNRVPLQPHTPERVRSGDVVRFGQTIFYYIGSDTLKRVVNDEP
jgi:hypothetical protein